MTSAAQPKFPAWAESSLQALCETATLLLVILDDKGSVTYANSCFLETTGYALSDVVGRDWFETFIPHADRQEIAGVYRDVLQQGLQPQYENRILTLSGGERMVFWNNRVGHDEAGNPVGTVSVGADVTDLRRTEEQLRGSLEELDSVLRTAVDGVVTINERGVIEAFNPGAERLFGYSAAEVLGQNVDMLMPSPYSEEHDGYLQRYLETGEAQIIGKGREAAGLRKNGEVFPIYLAVGEALLKSRRRVFTGFVHDLTAQKEAAEALRHSEARFRLLVQTAGVMIVCLSPEHRILEWNDEAERITGWPREEVLGKSYPELVIEPEARDELRVGIDRVFSGTETRGFESTIRVQSGEERVLLWNASRLDELDGRPALLAVGQDITERKAIQQSMAKAAKLAALGELAGNVAHEVNNPIGIISGKARLLLTGDEPLPHKVKRDLEKIVEQCDRVGRLTHGLLDYCRPSISPKQPIDVQVPISKALSFVTSKARRYGIEIVEDMLAQPPRVNASGNEIEQVFLNLFLNAIDAMPEGGQLFVGSECDDSRLTIRVRDTGTGVDEETAARIFEPFFTTKAGKGTGLGLAICFGLIGGHDGTISLSSSPGQGAEFSVELPVMAEQD